jgi:RNA polymerase sigma-70 factor, ECF subfamily
VKRRQINGFDRVIKEQRREAFRKYKPLTNRLLLGIYAEEHMSTVTAFSRSADPLAQEFEELFQEHHAFVFRTAYSVTGNAQDAEDVLQTIFLRIFRREFPDALRKNPRGYLYRAAVNVALNTIRSRRHEISSSNAEPLEAPTTAEESPWSDELRRSLSLAMTRLRPRAVEILVLHYEHNYSDAEIAKMLGTTRGTVAVSLYRTRARLKKLLRAAAGEKR